MNRDNPNLKNPPSGAWSGYYLYGHAGEKHRMRLGLTFASQGRVDGEGIDDVGPFRIHGFFDSKTNHAGWTKAYVGRHTVEYRGVYDGRSICGDWTLVGDTGGFWIWPSEFEEGEAVEEGIEEPLTVTVG